MATSPLEGRLLTGRTFGSDSALDAEFVRDVVLNNLCHYADEYAQVRVNFAQTSASFDSSSGLLISVATQYNDRWLHVGSLGEWPIALREDGKSYRFRVRLAGVTPDDDPSSTRTYRMVICPKPLAQSLFQLEADFVWEASCPNNTSTWLTGASQGTNAWATQMEIPAEYVSQWLRSTATLTDVAGDEAAVAQCLVSVNVFAQQSLTDPVDTAIPILGLYVAEWIGT